MATVTIIADQTSVETGPLNPAINTFAFTGSGLVIQDLAARVAMYSLLSVSTVRTDTAVVQLRYRSDDPAGPTVPIPFPSTEFAALWADLNTTFQALIPSAYSYGDVITRTTSPTIRGASVCMNERVANPAAVRGGRHFLPFVASDAVDGDGLLAIASVATITRLYEMTFLGIGPASFAWATVPPALPVSVWSRKNGVASLIVSAQPQRILSRPRSRTR